MRKRAVTVRGKYLKQEEQTLYSPDTAVISRRPLGLMILLEWVLSLAMWLLPEDTSTPESSGAGILV